MVSETVLPLYLRKAQMFRSFHVPHCTLGIETAYCRLTPKTAPLRSVMSFFCANIEWSSGS